jgi:hypothetical protein
MKVQTCAVAMLFVTGTGVWAEKLFMGGFGDDPRARALMKEAYKMRYTWGPEVTAVEGKFTWSTNEGQTGSGTFRDELHKRHGLSIAAEGSVAVPDEVRQHIGSLIMHRTPSEDAGGGPWVILLEDDERGPLILTTGDIMLSSQRVKDGKIVQVNRRVGMRRFTIDVNRFEKSSDGRYCPADITVVVWDGTTGKRLQKQVTSTQGFYVQDGQMFPKAEKIVDDKAGKTSELEIRYSEVKFETGEPRAAQK